MKRIFLVAALATLAACTDSNDPFLLDHAQILAVRAEPAHALPGGSVRIDVLAGDAEGELLDVVPDSIDAGGLPAERRVDGWYVTSPTALAPTISVTLTIDGEPWTATKELVFGDSAANPTVAAMQVGGSAAQAVDVAKGEKPVLDVASAGVAPLAYAWYTSLGKLDHYREAEATFDADAAGDGIVCVVVRDAQGGVTWQAVPAHVE
jgi:hypothetical protein